MSQEEEEELPLELTEIWTPNDVVYYGPASRSISLYNEINKDTALVTISQILEMENRRGQNCVCLSFGDSFCKMIQCSCSAGSYEGNFE